MSSTNALSLSPTPRLPPTRTILPYIGDLPVLALAPEFMLEHFRRSGPIFQGRVFGRRCVIMVGPEACRFVLAEGADHFSWKEGWPDNFTNLLGHGLFAQDGEHHRKNRAALSPAFRAKALASYIQSIQNITREHLARWERKRQLTMFAELKSLTFEVAARLLLGVRDSQDNERLSTLFSHLVDGIFAPPIRLPGTKYSRALSARRELLDFVEQAIFARAEGTSADALGMLVAARTEEGAPLPVDELKDHAILLAFAGHDTTTSMMTSLCMRLAQNPEVTRRCREEQSSLDRDADLSFSDLAKMPYLEQVLREVERLDPPVGGGFRGVVKPFSFAGYDVPAGWLCQYQIALTHEDSSVWSDAKRFDPDRFSPERAEQKRKGFSLLGFGGGPRICLGMGFAQLEMKIIASELLRNYEWELAPRQNLRMSRVPTTRPRDGLKVHFRARPR